MNEPNLNTSMIFHERIQGDAVIFSIEGSMLGDPTQEQFRNTYLKHLEAGKRFFIVDLGAARQISSAGLGTFISLYSKTRPKGGELILVNVPAHVVSLFKMTKLDTIFHIQNTLNEALEELARKNT